MTTFKDRHGEITDVTEDAEDQPIEHHGEEITDDRAQQIADELHAKARRENLIPGGKSLSGGRKHSPLVQFRVPEDLRRRLEERAEAEHRSASKVAREALEQYLAS